MKKTIVAGLLLTVSWGLAQTEFEKGIAAYNNRAQGSVEDRAQSEYIGKAIIHFEKALKQPQTEEQVAVYLLRSYYFQGKYVVTDEEGQKSVFQKGKDVGENYIAKFPDSAAIRYWYLANLGSWAEVYGILAAAREGVADLMKEHSEKIMALDPAYEDGGGYFMLGAVHYKSPYIPFILSWPDNDDAVKFLTKAFDTGDATPSQKVYLAQALYKDDQEERAIQILEDVAGMSPSEDEPVDDWEQIKKARGLLEKYK